jgi:hypothetical protein
MAAILLRIVLRIKCLVINNVKDVKPFTRIRYGSDLWNIGIGI